MSAPHASVVVCTMNRSRKLAEACDAILELDHPPDDWELVIVDNGSTDDTLATAREIARREPARIRVIEEPVLGLSTARNAGVRHARGRVVAFIDDDAFPTSDWLTLLLEALEGDGVMAAGGPVDPLFAGELPAWFDTRYLPYLTAWDLGDQELDLHYNEFPRGANMAFRREVFDRFGGFSPHLGRKGADLRSCEETELCLRIERAGLRVVYVPGARVDHRVDASRIDEAWLLGRFGAQGTSEAIVAWMHGGFGGLYETWKRLRANADHARDDTGPGAALYRRLQETTLRAYERRAIRCPISIPRYRASDPSPF